MTGIAAGSRTAEVWSHALATFGSADKARAWMSRPTHLLGNQSPVELLDTDDGACQVDAALGRIEHGLAM